MYCKKIVQILLLGIGSLLSSISYAGNVTGSEVWLTRFQDHHGTIDYAFFSDIWGTIDEFQSIFLLSPLGDSYEVTLSPEGDQWGSDYEGPLHVPDIFTDGIYTFEVTYTDGTTDFPQAQLGGIFPSFPANLQLTNNLVSWNQWQSPTPTSFIEIEILTDTGGIGANLLTTATSYVVPEGVEVIEIELSFRNMEFPDGIKSSTSILVPGPECEFQLSQASYVDGETVTADVFHFANLTPDPVATEIKIWLAVPGIPTLSVTNLGADGSFVFPAGTDIDLGPAQLLGVSAALPRGSYEFGCRFLDPVTGELLAEDLNTFDIVP